MGYKRAFIRQDMNACRWIIPFSRQFVSSAIALTPLFPWAWKMAVLKWWLTNSYYKPCGLAHLIPSGEAKDMNYTGARIKSTLA